MSSTVGIITLGCARNTVDSEKIIARIRSKGFTIVPPEKADTLIINTCGFITDAKKESIGVIRDALELKKQGKLKKVVVWGCLSQRYPGELHENLPGADAFVGVTPIQKRERDTLTMSHLSYLKIAEGCKNHCAYCAIPLIRGPLESRTGSDILSEVRMLDKRGVKELVIAAQDTTAWNRGSDRTKGKNPLIGLLKKICATTEHIKWVRLMYAHPRFTTTELIDYISSEKKMCPYIDLPIQHVNDRLLSLMNRHVDRKQMEKILWYIKKFHTNIAVRTTVITGFPTETRAEADELCTFIKEYRFRHLGAFMYSQEENTPAAKMKNMSEKTKKARYDRVMAIQQDISAAHNHILIGSQQRVLVDEYRDGISIARMNTQAHEVDGEVFIKEKLKPGAFADVTITESYEYDLQGSTL
jgi:ribosomal protein S12 methylthiotransferase